MKRKRCEVQTEMCSPADWIRQDDWPVGIRNVGNTCWFSAVIQVGTSGIQSFFFNFDHSFLVFEGTRVELFNLVWKVVLRFAEIAPTFYELRGHILMGPGKHREVKIYSSTSLSC